MRGLSLATALQLLLSVGVVAKPKPCKGQACVPRDDTEPLWANIPSSPSLKWVPCYAKADCARLEVPMDYDDPNGAKVTLAVIRYRATDKKNYKGPVLFNSGGPGNSGVDWFGEWGDKLHNAVGLNHDIVSWDPRSFSRSVPRISCWATEQRRNLWAATSPGVPTQYDDISFLATLQHRAEIENSACVDMMGESGILDHISSTHHARDLHALMTALGQKKIRYVGQSYGCLLGTFFASMFPDKIERMTCDGNLDPREVVSGEYLNKQSDAGLLLDFFCEVCAAESTCAIHEPTAEGVKARFDAILKKARTDLSIIPVPSPFDYLRQLPTYTLVLGIMATAVSNPYKQFPDIAKLLALIEAGGMGTNENLLSAAPWAGASEFTDTTYRSPNDPDAGRKGFYNKYPASEDWTVCNDVAEVPSDLVSLKERVDLVKSQGPLEAARLVSLIACLGRKVRAKGLYTGPFGGKTSHPIFFTNARVDPATSVRMAYANSKMFSGSGLLVYEAYGHSMVLDSPCVVKHINTYFQNGTLPPADAECKDEYPITWG
ncbi:uncharacterized protein DNG_04462 [Cephalotrichum gorgonifer]|uniref:Uncharacterized protein n=1 Tax=Cephalotrichum gorgonifer TaxID=2041049 RepID=A0AAE8MY15_9PEZI|nr:uncharacterized protein DNG_04462 [Cephalotrichum gorgonifer]